MNIRHETNRHDPDEAFDAAMRDLHARALAQVSPQTRHRLRAARTAASAPRAPMRGFGWVLASGFAAVFALAIGLQWQGSPGVTAPTLADGPDTVDYVIDGMDTAVATLDENPDFYLWLASNDDTLPVALER